MPFPTSPTTPRRISAPFDLSALGEDKPDFTRVMRIALEQVKELPDLSAFSSVAVMSDFGGENGQAQFNTYSLLILGFDNLDAFVAQVTDLRRRHEILEPYSEFKFNKLTSGPRSRALPEFLKIVDSTINGALVTIAIDKKIESVFGAKGKTIFPAIEQQLREVGAGTWRGVTAEKVMRVCHAVAMLAAVLTRKDQKLFWYCDNDAINQTALDRDFEKLQEIFRRVLDLYVPARPGSVGMGKSFEKKSYLDDLLSVTDFSAGIIQDLVTAEVKKADSFAGPDEKSVLLRWLVAESPSLLKIPLQIVRLPNGDLASGLLSIVPAAG